MVAIKLLVEIVEGIRQEERNIMKISYISNGEKSKFRHHKDIRMPEGVEYVVPAELSGCEEQCFVSSKLKPVIRFRFELLEIDADNNKVQVWYAPKPRNFFKLSIKLTETYVHNLEKIMTEMSCAFLRMPTGFARGAHFDDISGSITQKSVIGMKNYIPHQSKRTLELAELIGPGKLEKPKSLKSFDYWVFDQEMLDKGFLLTVGNENGAEFIRKLEVGSLPEGKDIVTAYVRPYFCEEYDM